MKDRGDKDHDRDDKRKKLVEFSNPNPILTQGIVPGFKLESSVVFRNTNSQPKDYVSETWTKGSATTPYFIYVTLHPLSNQTEALAVAKADYYATTEKNQIVALGKPTPGSYSGQPIGDFCWAYTVAAPQNGTSSSVVVINGNYLFDLLITGPSGVDNSFTEATAKAIVDRLKDWRRPDCDH